LNNENQVENSNYMHLCSFATISAVLVVSNNLLLQRAQIFESEFTKAELSHAQMGLAIEFFRLDTAVADWANWDDTYQFIEDNNTNYLKTNLVPQALADLNLNLMLFVNSSGTIIIQRSLNFTSKTEIPFDSNQITLRYPTLLQSEDKDNHIQGILKLQEGPMLVTSAPILTSDYQGPPRGTVIFGRFLDTEEISQLSQRVKLPIDFRCIDDKNMGIDFLWANNSLSSANPTITNPINSNFLKVFH
jgi:sensor domain CHASE-containing protein